MVLSCYLPAFFVIRAGDAQTFSLFKKIFYILTHTGIPSSAILRKTQREQRMSHYFEGRYYKHQKGDQTLCLIAGQADGGPFIQVITNTHVWQYDSLAGCQIDTKGIRCV